MNKKSLKGIATEVIDLKINSLKILKKSINKNFEKELSVSQKLFYVVLVKVD